MNDIQLRPARLDDAAAVGHVNARSWRATYAGLMPPEAFDAMTPERSRRAIEGALAGGEDAVWVAVEDDAVRGFVRAGRARTPDSDDGVGEILSLYLDPDHRGRGLGRLLLRRAFRELERAGFRSVDCFVLVGNDGARRFYEREGLVRDGRRRPLTFAGHALDHWHLSADLADLPRE